ncbi:MAG: DUF3300 domain-containing protein [Gammaproteobacteria bacterium]|nr:DUF3300 domain-containing protein [Gammaproteobacteria bacterium]
MNAPPQRLLFTAAFSLAVLSAALLFTQTISAQEAGDQAVEERIPLTSAELEELVGPIALYPDNLVSIVLPASTFPLQIVQAARYLKNHEADPTLKHDQSWDDSVVALLNYPDVIELMNEDLDWTRQLGDAAVYQQTELLDAIQAFRERAYAAGNLKSDDRQVVTKREEIIVIEPTDPKVIYVPDYEPEVVVVRHVYPVYHYYPRAYPVYYYPYPYGHSFVQGLFWGVTLAFTIDWHAHHVHVRHHHHYKHPYYGRYYHYPYYRRHAVRIAYRDHIWRPRHHHRLRHRHTTARIKANRRIEAGRTRHTLHRKHTHHRFEGLGHKSAKRAHGSNRITHRRDTAVIRGDHSAKPRRHGERRAGSASRHPQAFAEKRNFKQRAERRRAHSSRPLEHRANRSGGFRSNQHSRDRAGFRAAPRHRIERGATARRGAVERRSAIASGRRGGRSLEGMAKHGRRDFRPRAGGRFKPETRFRGGGRSSFGGGSRRHVR